MVQTSPTCVHNKCLSVGCAKRGGREGEENVTSFTTPRVTTMRTHYRVLSATLMRTDYDATAKTLVRTSHQAFCLFTLALFFVQLQFFMALYISSKKHSAGMVLMPHYSHPSNPLQIAEQTASVFRRWMDG